MARKTLKGGILSDQYNKLSLLSQFYYYFMCFFSKYYCIHPSEYLYGLLSENITEDARKAAIEIEAIQPAEGGYKKSHKRSYKKSHKRSLRKNN